MDRAVEDEGRTILSDWLEAQSIPLNTRCGKRGICRGCEVELVSDSGATETVRACQITCADVLERKLELRVPEASFRDRSLSGVSAFEVDLRAAEAHLRPGIGLALDIGTTTVAGALWDLSTGKCLGHASVANEQRRFGDNVLSRIDHAVAVGGYSPELQTALVRDTLEPLLDDLCKHSSLPRETIGECVATGNTVMLHAFAGASLAGFASYPFKPVFLDKKTYTASELGFSHNFPITLSANLGPFVGADIAAGALASGMTTSRETSLLIDFGTNGEILLKHDSAYLATATAAGPAFEGGRLRCGSPARNGVVSSLAFEDGTWRLHLSGTDHNARPTGLSGAAYVDFLAHAVEQNLLSPMGRFDPQHPEVETYTEVDESGRRVRIDKRLFVTEADVAELIQAKAAIAAGVMTLLEVAGLALDDVHTLYIAGGFGYHLNSVHAMAVGMMPTFPKERVRIIGNASLGGASLLLQSNNNSPIEELRAKCEIVELNQIESFEDHFIDSMPLASIED